MNRFTIAPDGEWKTFTHCALCKKELKEPFEAKVNAGFVFTCPACDPELNDGSWEQPGKIYDADPTG